MGTFEFIPTEEESAVTVQIGQAGLGSAILLDNARWFTHVRWIVVLVFIILGSMGVLAPGLFERNGLFPPSIWPWILAGVLVVANIPLSISINHLKDDSPRQATELNIWIQIIIDLLVVSWLVYEIGSTDTLIPFTYLFHIALACIFFHPRNSLIVTFIAIILYLSVVLLETAGVLPVSGILIDNRYIDHGDPSLVYVFTGSAVFVWLIMWYFVSTLSTAVRKRDEQLREANERLIKIDKEKTQQMLVTTHELKAPFVGIESNIQLLKYQFWGEIPESIRDIINRIDTRAHTLRERISMILTLGDLKMRPTLEQQNEVNDLSEIMHIVLDELHDKAKDRKITIEVKMKPISVLGNQERLRILFSNVIANAIYYSYEGGTVGIASEEKGNNVVISIGDHGIGIREDALPHIFDEYYRAKEASKFNKESTGLGLSMVKEIARNQGLGLRVTSEQGKGTTFEVIMKKIENR